MMKHQNSKRIFNSILTISLLITYSLALTQCDSSVFQELIKGYPFEEHTVTTEDGYILTLFRIQAKGQSGFKDGLKPVFLQHGLVSSADDWCLNTDKNSIGLVLANKGYDIWLGNNRGNKYSMNHTSLSIKSRKFWDFSF